MDQEERKFWKAVCPPLSVLGRMPIKRHSSFGPRWHRPMVTVMTAAAPVDECLLRARACSPRGSCPFFLHNLTEPEEETEARGLGGGGRETDAWTPCKEAWCWVHPGPVDPRAVLSRLFGHRAWRKPAHPTPRAFFLQMNTWEWEFQHSRTFGGSPLYVFTQHMPACIKTGLTAFQGSHCA